jgi:RNA polymerase sigma factor (sigma-70 family)
MAHRDHPDETLGRRFRDQVPSAVAEVRRVVGRIVRFRGYFVEATDREDLVQEVMLQLLEATRQPGFDPGRGFEGFVRVVVARRCIDWMRTRKASVSVPEALPDGRTGPLQSLMHDERVRHVREVLRHLSHECQELIRLRVREGATYAAIASSWKKSEGALRFRLHQCVKRAREMLERRLKERR